MVLDLQYKLKSNPNYIKYLRENSHWYKTLNRNPSSFNMFEEEVKTNYKLRPTDKLSKALDTFDMIQTVILSLK